MKKVKLLKIKEGDYARAAEARRAYLNKETLALEKTSLKDLSKKWG